MNIGRTALLCLLIAGTGVTWAASQARAQGQWVGGVPVFESDIEQRERALEAERAERRKSYEVAYPKYMDGGEKPDIAPEEPPVVYLDKDERPGTIIVDTGGRQLYYVLPGNRALKAATVESSAPGRPLRTCSCIKLRNAPPKLRGTATALRYSTSARS